MSGDLSTQKRLNPFSYEGVLPLILSVYPMSIFHISQVSDSGKFANGTGYYGLKAMLCGMVTEP
jgi:hypothetical protein